MKDPTPSLPRRLARLLPGATAREALTDMRAALDAHARSVGSALDRQQKQLDELGRVLDRVRREDLRAVREGARETRNALQRQAVTNAKFVRDAGLVREQKVVEERVLAWLSRMMRREGPVVFGPWTGEVGFELMYWVPFLRWVAQRFELPPERIIVVSRGGTEQWYRDFAAGYVDVFDSISPEQLQRELRQKKQREISVFDRRLLAGVRKQHGARRLSLVHPLLMYRLFMPYWKETDSVRRVERFSVPARMPAAAERLPELPARYVAVRFYFSDCMPDTPANRALIDGIVQGLAAETDVVVLDPGFRIDDHSDWAPEQRSRVHTLRHLMTPSNNLGVQTAAIQHASAFVGTYGGFSYLAPLCGVDTLALYSERNFYVTHLDRARRMFEVIHGGRLVPVETGAIDLLRILSTSKANYVQ